MWLASQFFEGCARALRQRAPPSNNLELDGGDIFKGQSC
jgi:hypothetical protein